MGYTEIIIYIQETNFQRNVQMALTKCAISKIRGQPFYKKMLLPVCKLAAADSRPP